MYDPVLKVFIAVAELGSFTKAAEQLYLSPTAVKKQIDLFEKRTDLKLFERTARGVKLTAAGNSLYKDAQKMIRLSSKAIENAKRAQGVRANTIRVGTSALYPGTELIELWNKMETSPVQFSFRLVPFEDANTRTVRRNLGREIDVLVGPFDSALTSSFCKLLPLGSHGFGVAIPKTHRLAAKELIRFEDLRGEEVMIHAPGNSAKNDQIRGIMESEHPSINIINAPHHYDMSVFNHCAENGNLLIALMCWQEIHPSLVMRPLDVNLSVPYGVIYPARPGSAVEEFVRIIEAVVG